MERYLGRILYYSHCTLFLITIVLCIWAPISAILGGTNTFVAKDLLAPFPSFFLAIISSLLFYFINYIFSYFSEEKVQTKRMRSGAVDILISIVAIGSSEYIFWYKNLSSTTTDKILAIILTVSGLCLIIRSTWFFIKYPPRYLLES